MSKRGFYGIGIWHPKREHNVGTLLRTANIFGAAFVFTVGKRYSQQASDTMKTPRHIPLFHFADIIDLREHLPHACPLVGIELTDAAELSNQHHHMPQACYLLGAEDAGLSNEVLALCHTTLRLPGKHSMNVAVAGSLVIYDRWKQMEAKEKA